MKRPANMNTTPGTTSINAGAPETKKRRIVSANRPQQQAGQRPSSDGSNASRNKYSLYGQTPNSSNGISFGSNEGFTCMSKAFVDEKVQNDRLRNELEETKRRLAQAETHAQTLSQQVTQLQQQLNQEQIVSKGWSAQFAKAETELNATRDELDRVLFEHLPRVTSNFTRRLPMDPNILEEEGKRVGGVYLERLLGTGGFGSVWAAKNGHEPAAIKVVKKSDNRKLLEASQLGLEICLLQALKHPNIVRLYKVINAPKNIYLAMELSLMDVGEFRKRNGFSHQDTRQIMKGVLLALTYMHSLGVAHMDLKPANILIAPSAQAKARIDESDIRLCDLGLASVKSGSPLSITYDEKLAEGKVIGTQNFLAPEMVTPAIKCDGCSADIFSVGAVLLDLLLKDGFPQEWCVAYAHCYSDAAKFVAGLTGCLTALQTVLQQLCSTDATIGPACNLVMRLLKLDPKGRLSSSDALQHPWITGHIARGW